jgi:hypothetical protein
MLAMVASGSSSAGVGLIINDPAGQVQRIAAGTVSTPNWAGYAAGGTKGSFSSVAASWSQPSVTCGAGENSHASFWVGLDGYTSRTVEQVGTDSDCVNGQPTYFAWYELFPKLPVRLGVPIGGATLISASVVAVNGIFQLTLNDKTVTQVSKRATLSSAEVIVEAPSSNHGPFGTLALADFVTVNFGGASVNGSQLASASPDKVIMESGGVVKAQPSVLAGNSFSVDWFHS